ncbi:MAG: hypothetical protein M3Q93_01210 [Gemmatimonadota bacterium]|nr:hypothetical protein [Gemmatimonadota bacterium]
MTSFQAVLAAALLLGGAPALVAQAGSASLSPTLPSDTLEANYAPRSAPGPTPELSPTLPSDTLDATEPVDSFPTDPFGADAESSEPFSDDSVHSLPATPADSAALRDLRSWLQHHPGLISPPPVRALLIRA